MFSNQTAEALKYLLDMMPDGVLRINRQGEIIAHNTMADTLLPELCDADAPYKERWFGLLHIEDQRLGLECWQVALENPGAWQSFQGRPTLTQSEGGLYEWRILSSELDGDMFCIVRDLTEPFQELSVRKKRLRQVYEETPIMAHAIDEKGRLLMVSRRWLERLGYTREEVIGRPSLDFLTEESQRYAKQTLPKFFEDGYCHDLPYQMVTKHGEVFDVELSATSEYNPDGSFSRSFATLIDVTERNKLFKALRKQNELLEAVFEALPDALVIADLERNIVHCNSSTFDIFGYTKKELVGCKTGILYGSEEEFLSAGKAIFNKEAENTSRHVVTLNGRRRDGELFPCQLIGAIIYNEDGEKTGFLGLLRDVSEEHWRRQQLDRQFALLQAFFDAIPYPTVITDAEDHVIRFNEQTSRVFGYEKEELLHARDTIFTAEASAQAYQADGGLLDEEEGSHTHFVKKGGEVFPGERIHAPILNKEGQLEGKLAIMRDLSDILEQKQTLMQTNSELMQANKDLERFAYVASHDLQEPLRKISSFLSLIEDHLGEQLDDTGKLYFHYVLDGADRMRQLIRDLLTYSRGGEIPELESCNLLTLFETTMQSYQNKYDKVGAEVVIQPLQTPPYALSHDAVISQVFSNLLSNALKYAHPERALRVEVRIESNSDRNAFLKFSMRDNGLGIDPKFQHRVFELFQRLHRQNEIQGQGIGLALCKKIVEKQGGQFGLESDGHSGSTFWFTLRRSAPPTIT